MVKRVHGCCGCEAENTACCTTCSEAEYVEMTCDWCGEDVGTLYWCGGSQICADCLLGEFDEVETND